MRKLLKLIHLVHSVSVPVLALYRDPPVAIAYGLTYGRLDGTNVDDDAVTGTLEVLVAELVIVEKVDGVGVDKASEEEVSEEVDNVTGLPGVLLGLLSEVVEPVTVEKVDGVEVDDVSEEGVSVEVDSVTGLPGVLLKLLSEAVELVTVDVTGLPGVLLGMLSEVVVELDTEVLELMGVVTGLAEVLLGVGKVEYGLFGVDDGELSVDEELSVLELSVLVETVSVTGIVSVLTVVTVEVVPVGGVELDADDEELLDDTYV
ncbi:hypothetical protein BJ546DRAFT_1059516 [Cryomyces antarcticus]